MSTIKQQLVSTLHHKNHDNSKVGSNNYCHSEPHQSLLEVRTLVWVLQMNTFGIDDVIPYTGDLTT